MDYQTLKASANRHQVLAARLEQVLAMAGQDGGIKLDMKSLTKLVTTRDLASVGLPADFLDELREFFALSKTHCDVVKSVANHMEQQHHVESHG
ncbi:hypothetical protein [Enterovibrio coralii]|uniref:Uncharacterized protein n=1 Tax=Enterovibrio coralii TaxID=294935 RepID=A0A135I6Y1_9GAMM|nr:hypothetical protein [Enterovibrio coralii]KXF81210.1 hypothetical protein ATN88_00100 [Enterovibrio coralii]